VGVHAEEQRAADALFAAMLADGLARGQDVVLVEAARENATRSATAATSGFSA
jgi:hypothetical protein